MSKWSCVRWLFLLGGVIVASVACGPKKEGLDPSNVPDDMRDDYALFERRCSKCHSLARPLNAGITDDDQWVMYVNRMRRQPGSGISMTDQEHILRFLRWYAADLRRRAAEKRGDVPTPVPAPSPSAAPPVSAAPPTSAAPPASAAPSGGAS